MFDAFLHIALTISMLFGIAIAALVLLIIAQVI